MRDYHVLISRRYFWKIAARTDFTSKFTHVSERELRNTRYADKSMCEPHRCDPCQCGTGLTSPTIAQWAASGPNTAESAFTLRFDAGSAIAGSQRSLRSASLKAECGS